MPDPTLRCAICHRPTTPGFRPFCSKRCADIDLGRWFTESYRVPASASDAESPDVGIEDELED